MVAEEKIEGSVGFKDYQNLFSFSIGTIGIVFYLVITVFVAAAQLSPSYVLAKWTSLAL